MMDQQMDTTQSGNNQQTQKVSIFQAKKKEKVLLENTK
jgi:hypothetical protein